MGLREMLTLLHHQSDGIPPVTLIPAGQVFAKFSGLRTAEGPCTRGQTSTLSWITDTTQYTRMIEWTFDLPDGVTMDDIVAALAVLLERHESLRTTYSLGEPPVQRVAGDGALAVDVFDVAGTIPPGGLGVAMMAGELVARLRATEFDPEADLPLRVAVAMAAGAPRAAVAVFSHVAADLVAMAVVGRQFTDLAGDPASRVAGPRGHQPLDQAMAERSPTGERRAATALRDWQARLRSMPQLMFALPRSEPSEPSEHAEPSEHVEHVEHAEHAEHAEPGALGGWLLSTAGALALRHIAARTGMRRQAAVLAALCAVLSLRTGQDRCVLSALANNRPERRLQEYVGMITSNTLISVNTEVARFDDLVRRTATATMAAGRACLADRAAVARVIREVEDERGIIYIRACVFNDATVDEAGAAARSVGDPADVIRALGSTELRVRPATEIGESLLLLALMRVDEELVLGALTTDSGRVPRADIEALLRGVERLLVAAAADDVSLNRVAEITGVRPAVRDETWLLVDSCWVEQPEVQRLLDDALPGSGARIFPVPGAGDEGRLVAYLTAAGDISTPAQAHAACMTVLRGTGRAEPPDGVRFTAMAPAWYVICDRAPDDPSDLAAWQRQRVLAEGAGRR
jgi:Condensation domain